MDYCSKDIYDIDVKEEKFAELLVSAFPWISPYFEEVYIMEMLPWYDFRKLKLEIPQTIATI